MRKHGDAYHIRQKKAPQSAENKTGQRFMKRNEHRLLRHVSALTKQLSQRRSSVCRFIFAYAFHNVQDGDEILFVHGFTTSKGGHNHAGFCGIEAKKSWGDTYIKAGTPSLTQHHRSNEGAQELYYQQQLEKS